LQIVSIKSLCRAANVERIDAGPKGLVLNFRDNKFPNPAGLIEFISNSLTPVKLRPDHRFVYSRGSDEPPERLKIAARLLESLAGIAAQEPAAA